MLKLNSYPILSKGAFLETREIKTALFHRKKNFDAEPLSPYSKHLLFFPILAACKKIFQQKRVRH